MVLYGPFQHRYISRPSDFITHGFSLWNYLLLFVIQSCRCLAECCQEVFCSFYWKRRVRLIRGLLLLWIFSSNTVVDNTVNWLILTFISTHFLLVPFRGSQNQRLHVLCRGVTFPFCSYDGKHKETEKIIKVKAGWILKSDFKTLVWDRAVGVCASRCSIF